MTDQVAEPKPSRAGAIAGRPVVDPGLLLAALDRLRAAGPGSPAPRESAPSVQLVIDAGTPTTVSSASRPALVVPPTIRVLTEARSPRPIVVPTGLAAFLGRGYPAGPAAPRSGGPSAQFGGPSAEPDEPPIRPT